MEIKKYRSIYKKAVLDISKRDIKYKENIEFLEQGLYTKNKECLLIFDEGKFKGYILGYPNDKDSLFILHWASKDRNSGVILCKHYFKKLKDLGYKYWEGVRDQKYIRREL